MNCVLQMRQQHPLLDHDLANMISPDAKKFRYVTPHYDASERSWQGRNEQPMITTRNGAGNRAGGITAESVGHEPFAGKQEFARHLRAVPRHRTNDGPDCFKLLVHQSWCRWKNRSAPFSWLRLLPRFFLWD